MNALVLISLLAGSLALATSVSAQEDKPVSCNPGPFVAQVTEQATLDVPEGRLYCGPEEAKLVLTRNGNFPDDSVRGLVAAPQEGWIIVLRYFGSGYVQDSDAKDWNADELLSSIKSGTDADNEKRKAAGRPPLTIVGWAEVPRYDAQTHKVTWAIVHRQEGGEDGVNYNTLALGRYGYISMNLVTRLAKLPTERHNAETMLANLTFKEGSRYADFSETTDKVAAVGLAALIAGVAVKTGLLAKLWVFVLPILLILKKFAVYIVVVLGGGLWRFFKRRRTTSA
jgi:uncharacterized membrane-anchored protein